jgi:hypothetical protein
MRAISASNFKAETNNSMRTLSMDEGDCCCQGLLISYNAGLPAGEPE